MRYSASDKLEIIRLVETSSLSVRRTLGVIGLGGIGRKLAREVQIPAWPGAAHGKKCQEPRRRMTTSRARAGPTIALEGAQW